MPTMTLRLSEETSAALAALSKATDCSTSSLAVQAIDEYLRLNAWQVAAIREGLAEAEAGDCLAHETLRRHWELRRARCADQRPRGYRERPAPTRWERL